MVEGLESRSHRWVVGVQWHPERPEPETPGFAQSSGALWEAFAAAVKGLDT
jgi:gamma-glutamyl-gamma-aminobutyrate hydrolase PuuD